MTTGQDQPAARRKRRVTSTGDDAIDALYHGSATAAIGLFCGLTQALRLYDINNATVIQVLGDLLDVAKRFGLQIGEPLGLSLVDRSFFVNRRLVRMTFADYKKAQTLRALWTSIGVGEIVLPVAPTMNGLQEFAGKLSAAIQAGRSEELTSQPWGDVVSRPLLAYEAEEATWGDLAVRTYVALLVTVRQLVASVEARQRPPMLQLKRILQGLVDRSERFEALLFATARRLSSRNELAVHLANVCLYSLALGRRLQLPRSQLMALATGALFHDLPKASLKDSTLNGIERPEALAEKDRERVGLHWIAQTQHVLALAGLSDESLARLVVLFEAQLEFTRKDLYGAPGEGLPDLSLLSRVIAVADAFDTWTWGRPGRDPRTPHQAMMAVLDGAGRRFEPALVRLLLEIVGFYAPGCAVLLATGETAVVTEAREEGDPERPAAALVVDAQGNPLEPQVVELQHDPRREVVWSLEADRLALNPIACLAAVAPR
jgi:HD-GYP domain-containing protein (c-di-GMP phosphodiesterase class II)